MTIRPSTDGEILAAVREHSNLWIAGTGSREHFRRTQFGSPVIEMSDYTGVVDYSPADQVITIRSGTRLSELQSILSEHGQTLPIGRIDGTEYGTVGGGLSLGLPHPLQAWAGGWRDSLLAMRVMLSDGTVAKSGAKVVKSVAGYDAHKLFVGGRGGLGIILDATFKVQPTRSQPASTLTRNEGTGGDAIWIQKVLAEHWEDLLQSLTSRTYVACSETRTVWVNVEPSAALERYPEDQVVRSHCGTLNLDAPSADLQHYTRRAKEEFDPTRKFNPGELEG